MDNGKTFLSPEIPSPIQNRAENRDNNTGNKAETLGSYSPELKVQPMPGESMSRANDAVSQAISSVAVPQPFQPVGVSQAAVDDDRAQVADDSDVIEKEWIDKAKSIVARTTGDPHEKSVQLTYLKKDYIQKRYGKIIRVPEDQRSSAK